MADTTSLLIPLSVNAIPRKKLNRPRRMQNAPVFVDEQNRYFVGTWVPKYVPPHPSDFLYTLPEHEVARPDLVSYRFYATPNWYWVILYCNDITDPFEGMHAGMILRVPDAKRILNIGAVL